MRNAFIISAIIVAFVAGVVVDYVISPRLETVHETMPIRLTDADFPKLQKLTKKGDTYIRYATIAGVYGIMAVRQPGGIWVMPYQEVGPMMAVGTK